MRDYNKDYSMNPNYFMENNESEWKATNHLNKMDAENLTEINTDTDQHFQEMEELKALSAEKKTSGFDYKPTNEEEYYPSLWRDKWDLLKNK